MRVLTASLAAALIAALAAPAPATEITATLGPAPVLGGGSYSTGGGLTVAVEPRRTADGHLAICGVWAESRRLPGHARGRAPEVLQTGSIAVDGVTVLSNLRFLQKTAPAKSYSGAQAGCRVTARQFTGAERLEVRIPRQVVMRDRGGLNLRFGAAERPNPALGAGSLLPESWTHWGG
ncbi:hypothetical protein [Roseovarius aestuariivivens]|uniref:hypothetical protein n=1 Tax=Roseovarius aestuariivivens TaxID=1888910 RepID=UPI001080B6EF|nr:hypothetical protein [Roseovarius aestuariivivens]